MKTTVDHAVMRGLATAGPVMRRGASSVKQPASDEIRLVVDTRVLLAVTVPPALPSFRALMRWLTFLGVTEVRASSVHRLCQSGDCPDEA
jgi:hypothetical protein